MGIPERYYDVEFFDWEPDHPKPTDFILREGTEKAHMVASNWAWAERGEELSDSGFMLLGPPGTGKTHLVCAAAKTRMEQRIQPGIRFVNVPLFLDDLRAAVRYTESVVGDLFTFLRDEASVVILDDLGKERATDWASERLYVLVESRYQKMRSTIATSNRSLSELDALGYGPLISRLQETGPVVEMTKARDYRPEKGNRHTNASGG